VSLESQRYLVPGRQGALICLDELREFSTPEQRIEFLSISVLKHLLFEVQPPRSPGLNHLDFMSLGRVKP
jgi:hypothetical protein